MNAIKDFFISILSFFHEVGKLRAEMKARYNMH